MRPENELTAQGTIVHQHMPYSTGVLNMKPENELTAQGTVTIQTPVGLHARPAVKLTLSAKKFNSEIMIRPEHTTNWINAKSTNAVMKMKAVCGETLHILAEGNDANDAVEALKKLIESFD